MHRQRIDIGFFSLLIAALTAASLIACGPEADFPETDSAETDSNEVAAATKCKWDFENGGLQGWSAEAYPNDAYGQNAFEFQPTFGNNVSITRVKPPSFRPEILEKIGGDYWEFSYPIGYEGKYWIGTNEKRMTAAEKPGTEFGARARGYLRSPVFPIEANGISFLLGGTGDKSLRVELQVKPKDFGDMLQLMKGFEAEYGKDVETRDLKANKSFVGSALFKDAMTDGEWVVVRALTPSTLKDGSNTDVMQPVAFDVTSFVGREARLRIVDESLTGHINVDDFQCASIGALTKKYDYNFAVGPKTVAPASPKTTHYRGARRFPLWGFADAHGHLTAHLGFGGKFIFGAPDMNIDDLLGKGCEYKKTDPILGALFDGVEGFLKEAGVNELSEAFAMAKSLVGYFKGHVNNPANLLDNLVAGITVTTADRRQRTTTTHTEPRRRCIRKCTSTG